MIKITLKLCGTLRIVIACCDQKRSISPSFQYVFKKSFKHVKHEIIKKNDKVTT